MNTFPLKVRFFANSLSAVNAYTSKWVASFPLSPLISQQQLKPTLFWHRNQTKKNDLQICVLYDDLCVCNLSKDGALYEYSINPVILLFIQKS